jgi:glycosyltransferase involved in cell wall biosynthesis
MNKALVVGPNVGVSMGSGGGVRVAAKMAETLAVTGFAVSLCAFRGYSLDHLDSIHNTNLAAYRDKIRTDYLITTRRDDQARAGSLSGSLPIHVGVLPISMYLQYIIRKFSPNVLIFHDDIPMLVKNRLQGRFTILYVHFSYATRLKLGVGDIADILTPSKESIEKLLNPLLRRLIFLDSVPADVVLANSSITAEFLKQTWNDSNVMVLHPPVDTTLCRSTHPKADLVVSIGTVQPNKRFEDIIQAMKTIGSNSKLVIIGKYHQGRYYRELQKLIEKNGLAKRVEILLDATQEEVRDFLSKAKILVHASRFEPFGIAVVEGMASGCVPIVYEGTTSGPWIDIVSKGEFGCGFRTVNELSEKIEKILGNESAFEYYSERAKKRSKMYDTLIFKERFIKVLRRFGS